MALALRAAACPGLDPGAFAFAILQAQSGLRRNDGNVVLRFHERLQAP
jgi:hypothetical protein